MRGILSYGAYLPHRRLDRTTIAAVAGTGGGKGTRTVASYDEDTTTLGVEAARRALAGTDARPAALWFSTVEPAYLDKTNATTVHAALRLDDDVIAADFGGAVRSSAAALRSALLGGPTALLVSAGIRTGLPGSSDEAQGGDAGAALLVGDDSTEAPVLAETLGTGSATDEFLDRWRTPGDNRSKQWEEKFGETRYLALAQAAVRAALADAGIEADRVDHLVIASTHARAAKAAARKLGVDAAKVADDLSGTVGNPGAAQLGLLLSAALDTANPGQVILVVSLADGADAFVFRATEALASHTSHAPVADQIAAGAPLPYGKFLAWRGHLSPEPPRRPEPARPSASAAGRSEDWKFGFVGSRDRSTGALHLPPRRVSRDGGAVDDMEPAPMADIAGTIVTYTIDKLVYSPSPPVVFAMVDFDGGGRAPIELTDIDPADAKIGGRVHMTFRRLFTADGIHNYFWKGRPAPGAAPSADSETEA